MNLELIKGVLELASAVAVPAAGLVVTLVGWKQTGRLDAKKALGHATKLGHVVVEHIRSDDPQETESTGVEAALKRVEETNGRRLFLIAGGRRLSKRVRAHVEDHLRNEARKAMEE